METGRLTTQAPAMPAAQPPVGHIKSIRRRLPGTVDEPRNIGYYLECLRNIAGKPDRETILREFFKETYV